MSAGTTTRRRSRSRKHDGAPAPEDFAPCYAHSAVTSADVTEVLRDWAAQGLPPHPSAAQAERLLNLFLATQPQPAKRRTGSRPAA